MGKWDYMLPRNVAKMKKTKKYKEYQERNIKDYYKLTTKILKLGMLSDRDSAHLCVMFESAATECLPKNNISEDMFAKLLDLSTKYSKKTKQSKSVIKTLESLK
jgi:hypothetical protein